MATATATATNVIPFDPSAIRARSSKEGGTSISLAPSAKKVPESYTTHVDDVVFHAVAGRREGPQTVSTVRLTQSELYPVRQAFTPEHLAALRLLTLAVGRSQRALAAAGSDDIMTVDTEMQKVQVLLPELFCCRTLGDGFGTVINAVMCAFESLDGNTPTVQQIIALNRAFQLLKEQPFLTTDGADTQVERLEGVGLNPYPAELVDFLSSDESIR